MLNLRNCTKTFFSESINEVFAFNNINLDVTEGEFLIVIGTNGSGKSSILNAITGNLSITSGTVYLNKIDITNTKPYKRAKWISKVLQNPYVCTVPNMTISENMRLAQLRGRSKMISFGLTSSEKENYIKLLRTLDMGLEYKSTSMVNSLSGGQRQALTLLMSVLVKPKLLLLDEHTAALDPLSTTRIMDITNRFIRQYQLTTIMVTHSIQHALTFGDTLIMMDKGKIVWEVKKEEKKTLTKKMILDKFNENKLQLT